jgi:hypothetical protein
VDIRVLIGREETGLDFPSRTSALKFSTPPSAMSSGWKSRQWLDSRGALHGRPQQVTDDLATTAAAADSAAILTAASTGTRTVRACDGIIYRTMLTIRSNIMAAIAVSASDEKRITRLAKRLGLRSKAGVVRLAVEELERRVSRESLGSEIREYVRKHGNVDRRENASLSAAGVARDDT